MIPLLPLELVEDLIIGSICFAILVVFIEGVKAIIKDLKDASSND